MVNLKCKCGRDAEYCKYKAVGFDLVCEECFMPHVMAGSFFIFKPEEDWRDYFEAYKPSVGQYIVWLIRNEVPVAGNLNSNLC